MKILIFTLVFSLSINVLSFAQDQGLLIDDFEVAISGGAEGTVDFGTGNGSSIEVTVATEIKHSGSQSLKVVYDAVPGGYMWVARGFGLDAKNTTWLIKPEDIDWKKYSAISFYIYGSNSQAKVAFDIKDNGNEMWRFIVEDNFPGWKEIVCPLAEFFSRRDWQPNSADRNANLDFPLQSYQFEILAPAKGTLYFDEVKLIVR